MAPESISGNELIAKLEYGMLGQGQTAMNENDVVKLHYKRLYEIGTVYIVFAESTTMLPSK